MLNLSNLTNAELVVIYNAASEVPLATKKFRDHTTAVERVGKLLTEKELQVMGTMENFELVAKSEGEPELVVVPLESGFTLEDEPEQNLLAAGYGENCNPNDPINEVEDEPTNIPPVDTEVGSLVDVGALPGPASDFVVEVTQEEAAALDTAAVEKVVKRRTGTKLEKLTQLLDRREGITNEEAKVIFGWPAISIKTMAFKMNLELQMRKEGRENRYFLASVDLSEPVVEEVPAEPTETQEVVEEPVTTEENTNNN